MTRSRFVFALVAAAALSVSTFAQTDMTGNWTASFNTPNGMMEASVVFKQEGETLTGTMSSQAGETAFKGTVKGKTFTFVIDVQTPNGNMSIKMDGEADGDAIKGTFDFGQGTGDWTAKRAK